MLKLSISYTARYEEIEACIAAHHDWGKWTRNEYTRKEKADIIAWYRDRTMIKLHQEAAVAKSVNKNKGKKKK